VVAGGLAGGCWEVNVDTGSLLGRFSVCGGSMVVRSLFGGYWMLVG